VESVDDQELLLFGERHVLVASTLADGHQKPFFEVIAIVEHLWKEEVQKRPELSEAILQRCSSEQEPVG